MEAHKVPAEASMRRVNELVNTPLSNIEAVPFLESLESEKKCASPVDTDVKDARRRINATRGPIRKKHKASEKVKDDVSDNDEDSN